MTDDSRNDPVLKVGYARVSTTDQNPDLQIEALKRYGVPADLIYVDHASGGTMKRPQFIKAMKAAQHSGCEFVVWKLDRLGRTMKGVLDTIEMLTERGITFVSLTESIDTKGAAGKLMLHIMAAFAELERGLIAERTKAGLQRKRERGETVGRPSVMTPERVAKAIEMIEAGASTGEIFAALKELSPPPISKSKAYGWVRDYKATHGSGDDLS